MGTLGNSSGCHLHFEVRAPGGGFWTDIDPTPFLAGEISVEGDDMSGIVIPWYWAEKNEQHCIPVTGGGNLWHEWEPVGQILWQNRELTELQTHLGPTVKLKVDSGGVPRPITLIRYPGQSQIFSKTKTSTSYTCGKETPKPTARGGRLATCPRSSGQWSPTTSAVKWLAAGSDERSGVASLSSEPHVASAQSGSTT